MQQETYDNRQPFSISSKSESYHNDRIEKRGAIILSLGLLLAFLILCGYAFAKINTTILIISCVGIGISFLFTWASFLAKGHEATRRQTIEKLSLDHTKMPAEIISIKLIDTDPKDPAHAEYNYEFRLRNDEGDIVPTQMRCALHGNIFNQESMPELYIKDNDFTTVYPDMGTILNRTIHYAPVEHIHQNMQQIDIPHAVYINKLTIVIDDQGNRQNKAILSGMVENHEICSYPCNLGNCYKYLGCLAYAVEDESGTFRLDLERVSNQLQSSGV